MPKKTQAKRKPAPRKRAPVLVLTQKQAVALQQLMRAFVETRKRDYVKALRYLKTHSPTMKGVIRHSTLDTNKLSDLNYCIKEATETEDRLDELVELLTPGIGGFWQFLLKQKSFEIESHD